MKHAMLRSIPVTLAALAIALSALPLQGAVVEVSGLVAGDTVWTGADTIRVVDTVTVDASAHLMVAPGTVVLFADATVLQVAGRLTAGIADRGPVVFTTEQEAFGGGVAPGKWRGIEILEGGNASFVDCDIRWAASGMVATRADVTLRDCRVTGFRHVGVKLVGPTSALANTLTVDGCTICSDPGSSIRPLYGLMAVYLANINVTGTTVAGCSYGVFLQGSKTSAPQFAIERSEIFNHQYLGIYAYGGG